MTATELKQALDAVYDKLRDQDTTGAALALESVLKGIDHLTADLAVREALVPRRLRKFLEAMQAGEMSVGRAVEILDAWVHGRYSDDMVPEPPEDSALIADDEFPMVLLRRLRAERGAPALVQALQEAEHYLKFNEPADAPHMVRIRAVLAGNPPSEMDAARIETVIGLVRSQAGDALADAVAELVGAGGDNRAASAMQEVGVVGTMPGTSGFGLCAFELSKVPLDAKLFAQIPNPGGKGS